MKKQAGFTLIELLIVIFVISMGLLVIIQGMSESHRYISETAQRTIALNLAKEGIEAVYNIRNSNWRRRSDQKNACRLKADPSMDEKDPGCADDPRITAWRRVIEGTTWQKLTQINGINAINAKEEQENLLGSEMRTVLNNFQNLTDNQRYHIYNISWAWLNHDAYEAAKTANPNLTEDTSSGKYWRWIYVEGLYDKTNGGELDCSQNNNCNNNTAKELRFCSTVLYTKPYQGYVNICSLLTNFERDAN